MNTVLENFLQDNNVNRLKLSKKVIAMLPLGDEKKMKTESTQIKSTGGFLRNLSKKYKQSGGGTVLPSEYFGKMSNSYHAEVATTNFTDATPKLVRQAIASTFKGGATKKYKFVTVPDLKKYNPLANKMYAERVNEVLKNVYLRAIKGGKMTEKSLIESFNNN